VTYGEKSEEKRRSFIEEIMAIAKNRQVFVEECGVRREYMREYAYAPRGESVDAAIAGRNGKAANVTGALCGGRHIGVESYGHATTAAFFEGWHARLLPMLPRACAVVLDNASFHRKSALEAIIKKSRRRIRLMFLPPYSPDLNPIEKSWANLKRFLRSRGQVLDGSHSAIKRFFEVA